MTSHKLHLNNERFELIKQGQMTIEARLYDERRQRIDIGDEISFINRKNNQTLLVIVHKLFRAPTFHELFTQHDPAKFGGTTVQETEKSMEKYYSYNDQLQSGVLGIEFVVKK
ncbi:ASCH domain-containing protein [Candidatus Saccharibacteria bacterium]|nr:ASCH domain-containing protein [Candidatus Saccharibacteria bacterium]